MSMQYTSSQYTSSVHVKEHQIFEISRALHYGMPNNHVVVVACKTSEIIITACRLLHCHIHIIKHEVLSTNNSFQRMSHVIFVIML